MSEILMRLELHNPEQAHDIISRTLWPYAKEQTKHGHALVLEARLLDDAITDAQRGYFHGVVLTEIAAFARPNGEQFPLKVWKEFFRAEFLGFNTVTSVNPITKKKARRRVRISTEDLGVRALAAYIDRVIAYAATDLGVQVSEPLPPHLRPNRRQKQPGTVDPDTGEITQ